MKENTSILKLLRQEIDLQFEQKRSLVGHLQKEMVPHSDPFWLTVVKTIDLRACQVPETMSFGHDDFWFKLVEPAPDPSSLRDPMPSIVSFMTPGIWLASIDLKDAYLHVAIAEWD